MCGAGMPRWGGRPRPPNSFAPVIIVAKKLPFFGRKQQVSPLRFPFRSEGEAPVEMTVQRKSGERKRSVLFAVVLRLGKLGSSGFMNIRRGKYPHPIKRRLQFSLILCVITIRGNRDGAADSYQCAAKGFGNHAAVPGFESPCSI